MVFCLLLDHNIMRLVFERGSFTADDTALMSMVFFYYSLSLLLYASFRILIFYLFARQEAWVFFCLSLLMYSLNAAFDLIYVGVFRLGAKGIPLGLLTALVVTSWMAFRRNICDLQQAFDRWLGGFMAKNLLAAVLAAGVVWALRWWLPPPLTGYRNFLYLCEVCGAGCLIYLVTLTIYRVIPLAQLATVWQRPKD
jgi:peptidoglycan biosynthesis protein MviN/MurJ (putative lipid II flippase)